MSDGDGPHRADDFPDDGPQKQDSKFPGPTHAYGGLAPRRWNGHFRFMRLLIVVATTLALTACGEPGANASGSSELTIEVAQVSPPAATPTDTRDATGSNAGPVNAPLEIDYLGRWDGADGSFLVVTDPPNGGLVLELSSGGSTTANAGSVTAEGLRFIRDGQDEIAVLTRGDGGRPDCLALSDAESYCRNDE